MPLGIGAFQAGIHRIPLAISAFQVGIFLSICAFQVSIILVTGAFQVSIPMGISAFQVSRSSWVSASILQEIPGVDMDLAFLAPYKLHTHQHRGDYASAQHICGAWPLPCLLDLPVWSEG